MWLNKEISDWDGQTSISKVKRQWGNQPPSIFSRMRVAVVCSMSTMLFSRVKIREIENKIKELYEMDDMVLFGLSLKGLGEWKRLSCS